MHSKLHMCNICGEGNNKSLRGAARYNRIAPRLVWTTLGRLRSISRPPRNARRYWILDDLDDLDGFQPRTAYVHATTAPGSSGKAVKSSHLSSSSPPPPFVIFDTHAQRWPPAELCAPRTHYSLYF